MNRESAALSVVIAGIYDASVDPTRWTLALKGACEFVGGAQAALFWQGSAAAERVGVFHYYNDDPFYTRLFLEKLAPLNPAFPAILFQEVGAVHTFSDLISLDEQRETVFYKEWIAPQGFTGSLGVVLDRDETGFAMLSFPWRDGAIDAAARQRLALLVPHIQRAVAIGRLFVRQAAKTTGLTAVLDQVGEAVFLLTGEGQVVFANAHARALVERGDLLRMCAERLHAVAVSAKRSLADGLRMIADEAPTSAPGASITLKTSTDGQWTAHLLPLADGRRTSIGQAHGASAALFVRRTRVAEPTPLEMLVKRHNLTAGETRVVEAMLRITGQTAIADALGVATSTVKSHLSNIYGKCEVKTQSELIKLVAGLRRN